MAVSRQSVARLDRVSLDRTATESRIHIVCQAAEKHVLDGQMELISRLQNYDDRHHRRVGEAVRTATIPRTDSTRGLPIDVADTVTSTRSASTVPPTALMKSEG
jgi:hypothetical protein